MRKKILCLLMAVIMILSSVALSSCKITKGGDGKPESGALTTKNLNNIYRAEAISLRGTPLEELEIEKVIFLFDDYFLISGWNKNGDGSSLYISDSNFKNFKKVDVLQPDTDTHYEYLNYWQVGVDKEDKAVWIIKYVNDYQSNTLQTNEVYASYVEDVVSVEPEDEYYQESTRKTILLKLNVDGEVLFEKDVTKLISPSEQEISEFGYVIEPYISGFALCNDCIVLCIDGQKILTIDSNTFEIVNKINIEDNYINEFILNSEGKLWFSTYGDKGQTIMELDLETGESTKIPFPIAEEQMYAYNILTSGGGYDLILSRDSSIYGFSAGDTQLTEICNYLYSDLDINANNAPVILPDGRIIIAYYDYNEEETLVYSLTKLAPEDVKEKYIITVASGSYINNEIRSALIKFNRTSDEYKVIFKTYSEYNNEENEWQGADAKLAEDIVNKAPGAADIVLLSSYYDYEKLTSKGALIDMNTLIDSDSSFVMDNYLEEVIGAMEIGGKLYLISPYVNYMTIAAPKSFVNGKTTWTMTDFIEAHNSLNEGEQLFSEATRDGFGYQLLSMSIDDFIDYETGKCSFDSDEFKGLLKYLKDIPADYSAYNSKWEENENYWMDVEMSYSKGTTKLYPVYLHSYKDIVEIEARYGEEVVLIGFPTNKPGASGAVAMSDVFLGINSSSKVKSGAWEVIKYLFSEEQQSKYAGKILDNGSANPSYMFPLMKSVLEKKKEIDIKPRYYTYNDDNGEEVKEEYGNKIWLGNSEITLRAVTDEDVKAVERAIENAKTVLYQKTAIIDIIVKEAQAYFEGAKSVDDVVSVINSSIQIYVSERM